MAQPPQLPTTMKALVLNSTSQPLSVQTLPVPEVLMGTALIRVLSAGCISYMGDIYSGARPYPYFTPMVPGAGAVARVAAVAEDATKLKPGDLVLVDCMVRSRDEPTHAFLAGVHAGHFEGPRKLMRDAWRNWVFAEYCRAPLENLFVLNETRLCREMGYTFDELCLLAAPAVPYGGLKDINLSAGQTVIVAPATGQFGGAAVLVAQAMGAKVIAMGRNKAVLEELRTKVPYKERIVTVPISGNWETDLAELKKHGPIDAFYDIGPPEAWQSSHIKASILAVRHGGKNSFMAGYKEDVPIPYFDVMHNDKKLFGKWMYDRRDLADLIGLLETGVFRLGKEAGTEVVGSFGLEEWKEAFESAKRNISAGKGVAIRP